jgi:hypothetical protein
MILKALTLKQDFLIVPEFEQLIEDWQKLIKFQLAAFKLCNDDLITKEQYFVIVYKCIKCINEILFHNIIHVNIMNNETDWKIIK